jgi:hypothetical protein
MIRGRVIRIRHNPLLARAWVDAAGRRPDWATSAAIQGVSAATVTRQVCAQLELRHPGTRFEIEYEGPHWMRRVARQSINDCSDHGVQTRAAACPLAEITRAVGEIAAAAAESGDVDIAMVGSEVQQRLARTDVHLAVVATMSSGKTTLVNAMIGRDLLPTGNMATTAQVTRVVDVDGMTHAEGRALDADGREVHCGVADADILTRWNRDAEVEQIHLDLDLAWIDNSDHLRLVVYDTPGPNYVGDPRHREKLESLLIGDGLDAPDLALYVMDYTRMLRVEDHDLLARVLDRVQRTDLVPDDFFLFAVNRVDKLDLKKDGVLEDSVLRHASYLQDSFGFALPRVYPVSASAALHARCLRNGAELDEEDRMDLDAFASRFRHVPLPKNWRKALAWLMPTDGDARFGSKLLLKSGLPNLQRQIEEHAIHMARPLRIYRCMARLRRAGLLPPLTDEKAMPEQLLHQLKTAHARSA